MTDTIKAVCVWHDTTSNLGNPAWIVSRDILDDDGRAETTTTLAVCETEDEAMTDGHRESARLGLPLYRNPAGGPLELVAEATEVDHVD